MDLNPLIDWTVDYYARYPIFCYAAGGILLLLTLWKPIKVLKNAFLLLILLTLLYFGSQLIGSLEVGMKASDKAAKRTEEAIRSPVQQK